MNIRFAFAVSRENSFENTHFVDAFKFLFYEIAENRIYFAESEINFHQSPREDEHGNPEKAPRMIRYLKERNIHVLVSMKFGKNIDLLRNEFLPIKVCGTEPYEVTKCLSKNLEKIQGILQNKKDLYPIIDARDWQG